MSTIPSYQEWKSTKQWPDGTSYDSYKWAFPQVMEYQVFRLDPNTKLSFIEGEEPLLETESLAEASAFIYDAFQKDGTELCIYQPRHDTIRGFYRKTNTHSKRDANGRFVKA